MEITKDQITQLRELLVKGDIERICEIAQTSKAKIYKIFHRDNFDKLTDKDMKAIQALIRVADDNRKRAQNIAKHISNALNA